MRSFKKGGASKKHVYFKGVILLETRSFTLIDFLSIKKVLSDAAVHLKDVAFVESLKEVMFGKKQETSKGHHSNRCNMVLYENPE